MELHSWTLFICAALVFVTSEVAGTRCYVCKDAVGASAITSHLNCPNVHDTTTTTVVTCTTPADSTISAPCVTFVGTQMWNPSLLATLPAARDSVVRLCLNDKAKSFLGTRNVREIEQGLLTGECRHADILAESIGIPKITSMSTIGLACGCTGDLCNNRFNANLLTYSTASKSSSGWTTATSVLLLISAVTFMQSN